MCALKTCVSNTNNAVREVHSNAVASVQNWIFTASVLSLTVLSVKSNVDKI